MKNIKNLAIFILMITTIIILSTKSEATTGKVNSETVRIRKEPNTKSTILDQLDKNDEVEILEEAEGWYKVNVTSNGEKITGYISKELVDMEEETVQNLEENNQTTNTEKPVEEPEENEPIEEPVVVDSTTSIEENKEYIIEQEVSIKALPLMNSIERATINNGNVKVLEIINDWCKIENNIESGWIRINLLKKSITKSEDTVATNPEDEGTSNKDTTETTAPETKPTNATVIKKAYVSTDSLKVRKEASTSSEVIDSLKKNDEVSIIEELDGWYKIKISGEIGYVSSKYISDTKVSESTSRGATLPKAENITPTQTTVEAEQEVTNTSSSTTGEAVVEYAKQYLGYKYVSGGASPSTGFDCSGFTTYVYKHFGITLNRVSKDQSKNGVAVEKSNLQLGDLVLFNGESNKTIGHVGIYVGSGNFIHASNPKGGVKIDSLSSSYYSIRYVGARRVI